MSAAPSPDQIDRFRASVERLDTPLPLGVAVSGGPDSLALLLLAHTSFPGRVAAATVDHRLRPEAAEEARFVAEICRDLGVAHATLTPDAPIAGNIQSAARAARYALLGRWCGKQGLASLATAHHLDDQAETLLMRLQRGSGVSGLAGVRARSALVEGVVLVRPLLDWRREELGAIVAAAEIRPVSDPSNSDERFDRVRMRRLIGTTPWIDPAPIAASAAALADSEAALAWMTDAAAQAIEWADRRVILTPSDLPREILRRLVLRILRALAPDAPEPRGEGVQALLDSLSQGAIRTLSGVKCRGGMQWVFTPAPPRRGN